MTATELTAHDRRPRHGRRARPAAAGRLDPVQHQRRAPGIRPRACPPPTCWPCWWPGTCATTGSGPRPTANDHLIFSKGHASPLLYSMFKAVGVVSDEELMTGYRRFGSRLEGHPTPVLPWVDVATGSLGQGLPDGVGVALAGKYLDQLPYRVWVLCGDSEMAEGSIWEALDKAGLLRAGQPDRDRRRQPARPARADRTGLGPRRLRPPRRGVRRRRWSVDGHDLGRDRRGAGRRRGRGGGPTDGDPGPDHQGPRVLRGRGPRGLARQAAPRGHGRAGHRRARRRAPPASVRGPRARAETRDRRRAGAPRQPGASRRPSYATRRARSPPARPTATALAALGGRDPRVVALDGEVSNSTYADEFAKAYPDRYFEMFIAEQQLVAAAVGLTVRGYIPFASTFAAFFTRAYDFIRMAADLAGATCGWSAPTPASRSAPTARRRWRWRTSR